MTFDTLQKFNREEANPFEVVHTTATTYTASAKELVITEGTTVELPSPTANAIVGVRDNGQEASMTSPSGQVHLLNEAYFNSEETVYFVSDGTDWYAISDTEWFVPSVLETALTEDMLAWYRFEDGDSRDYTATLNETFADTTAYNGTVNGATFESNSGIRDIESRPTSGAFSFDGTGDNINYGNPSALSFGTSDFTILLTVKFDSVDKYGILNNRGSCNNVERIDIRTTPDSIDISMYDGATSLFVGDSLDFDGYKQIALARNGSVISLTINGERVDSTTAGGFNFTAQSNWVLGTHPCVGVDTTQHFDGTVDDLRFYNRGLSTAELDAIYQSTLQ